MNNKEVEDRHNRMRKKLVEEYGKQDDFRGHYITLWYELDHLAGDPVDTDELTEVGWYPITDIPRPLFISMENFMKQSWGIRFE